MDVQTRSGGRLWKASFAAAVVAIVLLVVVVLPAEYGIDPTTIGGRLGLMAIQPEAPAAQEPAASEELAEIISGGIRDAEPGVQKAYAESFKSEQLAIELAPLEEVEFKARMDEGDTVLYSWTVQQPVYVDMHGEPLNYPEEPAVRYEEKDGVSSGNGRLTAPFSGLHGWYWLNTNESPVVVTLKVSGYYQSLEEVYRAQQ